MCSVLSKLQHVLYVIISHYPTCRCQVREAMLLANKHDLGKLTSCSLIILGQIFMALGNVKVGELASEFLA